MQPPHLRFTPGGAVRISGHDAEQAPESEEVDA
jgi:hypothetical protein